MCLRDAGLASRVFLTIFMIASAQRAGAEADESWCGSRRWCGAAAGGGQKLDFSHVQRGGHHCTCFVHHSHITRTLDNDRFYFVFVHFNPCNACKYQKLSDVSNIFEQTLIDCLPLLERSVARPSNGSPGVLTVRPHASEYA